jgi:hypothetical protein
MGSSRQSKSIHYWSNLECGCRRYYMPNRLWDVDVITTSAPHLMMHRSTSGPNNPGTTRCAAGTTGGGQCPGSHAARVGTRPQADLPAAVGHRSRCLPCRGHTGPTAAGQCRRKAARHATGGRTGARQAGYGRLGHASLCDR